MFRFLLATAAFIVLTGWTPTASARAGAGFRGPANGGVPPPFDLPCDCAHVECRSCSMFMEACVQVRRKRKVLRRVGDFAIVRDTFFLRRKIEVSALPEAGFQWRSDSVIAVTAGTLIQERELLLGSLRPSNDARRRYLWTLRTRVDPLLVIRRGPGQLDLRVHPVSFDRTTEVVLEAVVFAPDWIETGRRFYRTGDQVLMVSRSPKARTASVRSCDAAGFRLRVLTRWAARAHFPEEFRRARRVSFVPALACAISGRGTAAVSDDTALAALPKGARLPPGPPGDICPPPPPPPGEPPPLKGATPEPRKDP